MRISSPSLKAFILVLSLLVPFAASAQTPPDQFLGHQVGADRKLADYNQIKAYFEKLDQESPKLTLFTIGESVQKRPIIMAVITAEQNMAKLDAYREIARKLKDSRGLSADDARKLAGEGKVIVLITCSLHASEVAASQMSMEFAYDLVVGKTPFDAAAVLKDVIVLLVPTHNPDGNQMVVEWYRKYLGTKFEGGNMPWLYHVYAGHDNNRDWFMFNLPETRAVTKVLYHDWFPQIHIDEHQMGSNGARLFIPPFMDPPIPNVQPLLWRGVNLCGAAMAYDLQANGKSGVVHGRSFTGWWIGACDDTSWLHNTVGLLSEMASVRGATPINIEPGEVQKSYAEKRMEFPDPWPGGWWRLRDLVEYELILSMSLVNTAFLRKEDFLFNSYLMSKTSIETQDKNQPYAFVIPSRQHDYLTMLKMIDVLMFGGVEVERAAADFLADGKLYPAGSYVVRMAQPFKPYAWALLDKQKYPDLREYPGGPPVPPYDNAGWTLPLQMGVACDRIEGAFKAKLEKIAKVEYPQPPPELGAAAWFALDCRPNAAYPMVFALLKDKAEVYRTKAVVTRKGIDIPAGSFIVKNTPEVKKALPGLASKYIMAVLDLDDTADIDKAPLKFNRVGLYQSWKSNMDEGWTRFVFDDLGIPFTTIHNKDFKVEKGKKLDLKANYDVIVFPDENADIIKSGKPDPNSPFARWITPMPPEYEGGIEQAGVDALKAFVEEGGILVALNGAGQFAIKELQVPARDGLDKVESSKFFCPMSILKLEVDNTTPIGYGLPKTTPAVFSDSPGYETRVPPNEWDRKVVAGYPEEGVLMSGWLLGEDVIARKAAVVDFQYKKGRIILIGIVSQSRAQSHGTYKFLLNALLYPQI
ncbi:MAG: M14 family metallopeptidase [Candidatus Aminicenantes bacterium]|nr:M14 family metallopeptidase [Candidatus Aminicenantes bacterium]